MYQNKLQNQGVRDAVSISEKNFELCRDLIDRNFWQLNENLINN